MIDKGLEPIKFDLELGSFGKSSGASDLADVGNSVADEGKSPRYLESAMFMPKFGVLVETGIDDSCKLGGNFSSLL